VPVKLREREGRGGTGKKSASREDPRAESGGENGGEKRRNISTDEQTARGRIFSFVFVGFGVQRKRLSLPWEEKGAAKVLNEALVKRVIPFVYRNRVWTMDETL